jgi:hypothetical protein
LQKPEIALFLRSCKKRSAFFTTPLSVQRTFRGAAAPASLLFFTVTFFLHTFPPHEQHKLLQERLHSRPKRPLTKRGKLGLIKGSVLGPAFREAAGYKNIRSSLEWMDNHKKERSYTWQRTPHTTIKAFPR